MDVLEVYSAGLTPDKKWGVARPSEDEIEVCVKWLRLFCGVTLPSREINPKWTSHSLRRLAENWATAMVLEGKLEWRGATQLGLKVELSQGALIVAALKEGYKMAPAPNSSRNAQFNIYVKAAAFAYSTHKEMD